MLSLFKHNTQLSVWSHPLHSSVPLSVFILLSNLETEACQTWVSTNILFNVEIDLKDAFKCCKSKYECI